MNTPTDQAVGFAGLVDLASAEFGGRALGANDEFFAAASNLVQPGRGQFDPDRYTEQGKWMDGWETRRRRTPGHDWCVVELGVRGRIRVLDIDTNHFLGNHAPLASVEACDAPGVHDLAQLEAARWVEIVPQAAMRSGSQNLLAARSETDQLPFTHLRLKIVPDGGVARLRAWGEVVPGSVDSAHPLPQTKDPELAALLEPGEFDLAALEAGGQVLACSDMFFSPMTNLLAPGRPKNMAGGWETRRKRGPGLDWALVRLARPGTITFVEIDTALFKGNYPDRCTLWGIEARPDVEISGLIYEGREQLGPGGWFEVLPPPQATVSEQGWRPIVTDFKLGPDARYRLREELLDRGPFSHVRLDTFPDGGVARLRLFGTPA